MGASEGTYRFGLTGVTSYKVKLGAGQRDQMVLYYEDYQVQDTFNLAGLFLETIFLGNGLYFLYRVQKVDGERLAQLNQALRKLVFILDLADHLGHAFQNALVIFHL